LVQQACEESAKDFDERYSREPYFRSLSPGFWVLKWLLNQADDQLLEEVIIDF
jgi:hypothetical protein